MLKSYKWLLGSLHRSDLVVLDSRPKTAYLYGHLPGSHSLTVDRVVELDRYGSNLAPHERRAADLFGRLGIDGTKTVVVVGDLMDPSAARIVWTLRYFGHVESFLLEESFAELQRLGADMTRSLPAASQAKFVPDEDGSIRTDAEAILRGGLKLVDARSPQEFVNGHLPGAASIPFTDGLGEDGRVFRSGGDLERIFLSRGLLREDELACYCMHGHRASSLYFQLRLAGFERVRLYDGSFVEWYGRRLPLE